MRVYKPTYSVPIPPGSKRLKRKDGTYVRFVTKRGQEVTAKVNRTGTRAIMETSHYVIEFRDHDDCLRRLKAFTDEASSQRGAATVQDLLNSIGSGQGVPADLRRRLESLPAKMQRDLASWGLLDAKASMATRPLPELIELYRQHMVAQERSTRYIRQTISDIRAVVSACGFRYFSDIDADAVGGYLKVRRDGGLSNRRSNAILASVKGLLNWLVESDVIDRSPLRGKRAKLLDVQQDRRRVRRALDLDELRRLFAAAKASEEVVLGLTGRERALLYELAAQTGLRRGAFQKLTTGDFDLDTGTVTVPGRIQKNGKALTLAMSPDLSARLRQRFANRLPTVPWLRVPDRTAEMLRHDLKAAGLPYRDDRGHYFDFHALRGQCATLLIASGVAPEVAQKILDHKDIRLTMQTYARVLGEDQKKRRAAAAVASLIAG